MDDKHGFFIQVTCRCIKIGDSMLYKLAEKIWQNYLFWGFWGWHVRGIFMWAQNPCHLVLATWVKFKNQEPPKPLTWSTCKGKLNGCNRSLADFFLKCSWRRLPQILSRFLGFKVLAKRNEDIKGTHRDLFQLMTMNETWSSLVDVVQHELERIPCHLDSTHNWDGSQLQSSVHS